jgi:subtilase family serine protease
MVPAALVFSPSTPLALDSPPITITLTATIHNAGNTGAENVPVQFWAGNPEQLIGSRQTIPTLAARSPASVSVDWTDVPTGTYTVGVTVDPDNLIPESDENNNQRSWTPQMDLAPAALTSSPQVPIALDNKPVTITLAAVVYNIGNTDAKDVPVQFWVGDPGHPIGGVQTMPTLPARLEAGASAEWVNVTAGTYTIGVTADVDDLFSELDEDNNQFSRTLLVAEHGVFLPLIAKSYEAYALAHADRAPLNNGCGDWCTHATSYPIVTRREDERSR